MGVLFCPKRFSSAYVFPMYKIRYTHAKDLLLRAERLAKEEKERKEREMRANRESRGKEKVEDKRRLRLAQEREVRQISERVHCDDWFLCFWLTPFANGRRVCVHKGCRRSTSSSEVVLSLSVVSQHRRRDGYCMQLINKRFLCAKVKILHLIYIPLPCQQNAPCVRDMGPYGVGFCFANTISGSICLKTCDARR